MRFGTHCKDLGEFIANNIFVKSNIQPYSLHKSITILQTCNDLNVHGLQSAYKLQNLHISQSHQSNRNMTKSEDTFDYLERCDLLIIVDLSFGQTDKISQIAVTHSDTAKVKRALVHVFKENALELNKDFNSELLSYDVKPLFKKDWNRVWRKESGVKEPFDFEKLENCLGRLRRSRRLIYVRKY